MAPERPDHPARIMLIGEAPGEEEDRTGHPFMGPAGGWLMKALSEANILRSGCWITNILPCRPPNNDIESPEAVEALACCREGMRLEIAEAAKSGLRVILALGNTPAKFLFPDMRDGISKARGSVYEYEGIPVIPTFHPSAIMRSQERTPSRGGIKLSSHILRPVWVADLAKARRIADSGWKKPRERFNCFPNAQEIEGFLRRAIKEKRTLAVDIETTNWDPDKGEIVVVGVATDGETAMSIPFLKSGGDAYWPDTQAFPVMKTLGEALEECPTIFQNAKFDVRWLEKKGFEVGDIAHDVMLLHHVVSPELPHDLGFIVSVYGETPYWKGEMLSRDRNILDVPDSQLRVYNLRDAVVLHQVLGPLLADLEELGEGAKNVYRSISMKLIRPVMGMERRGMLVSKSELAKFRSELDEQITDLEKRLQEDYGLPQGFNLQSDEDMRLILYGVVAPKFEKAREELAKTKRKGTKKWTELSRLVEVAEKTRPFYLLSFLERGRTTTGKPSVGEPATLSILRKINLRVELIDKFKRPNDQHLEEKASLISARAFIAQFVKLNELTKLRSTYTSYPTRDDGRVHPSYLIHGTATGRLSCKDPNLQNQPEEVRRIFVARPGYRIVSSDYSNLELRVLAYVSNDRVLLDTFLRGLNVHDENTRLLFEVDEDHPSWKALRRAAKVYIFGRNYGGTLEGIFEKVTLQVPEAGLSFARFKAVDEKYRALHPDYANWYDEILRTVKRDRSLTNVFGRVRTFYGNEADIIKEGLNFPIQSAAADIINRATITLDGCGMPIVCQIHDALLFEVKADDVEFACRLIKREMEKELTINGRNAQFPVDISVGESWGTLIPASAV